MPVNEELAQYIKEHMALQGGYNYHFYEDIRCYMPYLFLEEEQRIRDFKVFEDDIWVLTYPKCGTTWTMEMVWLLGNNLDYKGAETSLELRFPFLEVSPMIMGDDKMTEIIPQDSPDADIIKYIEGMPRPRFIKSHLPVKLLPKQLFQKQPKVIFVLRDPKDTAVSFLNHYRIFNGYRGSADKFFEAFLDGCIQWGCYWHYVAGLWKLQHEYPNMLVLTYEEMKKDLSAVIRRTAKFLGKTVKDEDMPGLLDHLSFAKMKANDAINFGPFMKELNALIEKTGKREAVFMRKGEVGDYKNSMSKEMVNKYEQHHAAMKRKLGLADDKDFPY